eukprot:881752_1
MALKQFGDTFNRFVGVTASTPQFPATKYCHIDTDAATSNAVCDFGNGMSFRRYLIEIWYDWKNHHYTRNWNLVLVHCWCHITGYLIRNDDKYKD